MLPSNKTKNLRYLYHCAVGQRNGLTHNLDVHDGMTNSTSCTVKIIEYRIETTKRPSVIWVKFDDLDIGREGRRKYHYLYHHKSLLTLPQFMTSSWSPMLEQKAVDKI